MTIPVDRLIKRTAFLLLFGMVTAFTQPLFAQDDKELTRLDRQLNTLIRSVDDIIWSDITIYKMEDEYRSRLIQAMQEEDKADIEFIEQIGQVVYDDPLPNFAENVLSISASAIGKRGYAPFKQQLAARYAIEEDYLIDEELQNAYNRARSVIAKRESRPKDFYLVSSRDVKAPRLIALLGITQDETTGNASINKVWAGTELYKYLRSNSSDTTMYDELKVAIADGNPNLTNMMFLLRDMADIIIADRTIARATYISERDHPFVLESISNGRPIRGEYQESASDSGATDGGMLGGGIFDEIFATETKGKGVVGGAAIPGTAEAPYELAVGTDELVSFHSYKLKDKQVPEPQWGIELINNFDEINYPSIWGGRMTLNAILENVKIGAVLPQPRFGGNSIDSSGLFSNPQRIIGGYGIAFSGDFAAPVLSHSGLFNFHASYTFGEAETDAIVNTLENRLILSELPTFVDSVVSRIEGESAYLIRFAFQGYYSFGFYADDDANHLFRLKMGGTAYGVDRYTSTQISYLNETSSPRDTAAQFTKNSSKTVGGISAKIEYMKGGTKIPYGIGLQYFDQSILTNFWIQFAIGQSLDLKLEGKSFAPIFRDANPWENSGLIVPSVGLKYHFGSL